MSVGLDAALATLREKNHPGIMQTSAEVLLTILGNVRARHPHRAPPRKPLANTTPSQTAPRRPRRRSPTIPCAQIAGNPAEKKYRKLKPTNRLMAEKVLPAKGAKALLEAVGFAQAPGHAVLVMQGRDVDAALLGAAAEGLQRLLGEKEQREAERR